MFTAPLLADSQIGNLFHALGIDGQTLLFNIMAFMLVLAALAWFVYPTLTKALDQKRSEFETASRLEQEAKQHVAGAEVTAAQIMEAAKVQAREITAAARRDAAERQSAAEQLANARSRRIVQTAHEQLARDLQTARKALRSETAHLVAAASSKLMDTEVDEARDAELISRSLRDRS